MATRKSAPRARRGGKVTDVEVEPPEPAAEGAEDRGLADRERRARLEMFLRQYVGRLAQVLPKHLTPERMLRLMLNECTRVPKLLECTPGSILAVLVESSELGLELGGTMGLAHPIPRRFPTKRDQHGKPQEWELRATLVVGFRGLQALARRSGLVGSISAQVVREADAFSYEQGSTPRITHAPAWQEEVDPDGKDVVAAYCVVHLRDGDPQLEVMNRSQLEKVRDREEGRDRGPWASDFDEMARKTVFRRAAKWLPQAAELQAALAAEDRGERGEDHPVEAEVRTASQGGGAIAGLTRRLAAESSATSSPFGGGAQQTRQAVPVPARAKPMNPAEAQALVNELQAKLNPDQVDAARRAVPGWVRDEAGLMDYAAALQRLASGLPL